MKMTLDNLRSSIKELFDKATDAETIKRYAAVETELDKLQTEATAAEQKEVELLKDLKEAYMHTASDVKPNTPAAQNVDIGGASAFNGDAVLSDIITNIMEKK